MDNLLNMGAQALVAGMAERKLSAEELMRATLSRIKAANGDLNAIVSLRDADELLAEAVAADAGPVKGALHGVPVAIKDLADVRGLPTSQGSPAFAGQVAPQDSLHVARMRAAGAIFIGKTNTPEFGLGSQTFNPVHGVTSNPYDQTRTCGGSSGGAAVALSARMLSIADGSDMMGSLRNPAGWCNIYGFRPSWGRVPAEPKDDTFLHRLSTNGPMARNPGDLGMLLGVMAGADPRQPQVLPDCEFDIGSSALTGKRIGWLGNWGGAWPMEPGILELCGRALQEIEALGCDVEAVDPPFSRDALWHSWTILRSWSVAVGLRPLMATPSTRALLKDDAIWEAERGLAMSAMEVHEASVIRSGWFARAAGLFEHFDALVLPTAQVWPFAHDQAWPSEIAGQGMDTYHRWMEVTIPAGLIGLPALAMPAGFGANGLPMGLQLIGRYGDDRGVLGLAQAYHQVTGWPQRQPPDLP